MVVNSKYNKLNHSRRFDDWLNSMATDLKKKVTKNWNRSPVPPGNNLAPHWDKLNNHFTSFNKFLIAKFLHVETSVDLLDIFVLTSKQPVRILYNNAIRVPLFTELASRLQIRFLKNNQLRTAAFCLNISLLKTRIHSSDFQLSVPFFFGWRVPYSLDIFIE